MHRHRLQPPPPPPHHHLSCGSQRHQHILPSLPASQDFVLCYALQVGTTPSRKAETSVCLEAYATPTTQCGAVVVTGHMVFWCWPASSHQPADTQNGSGACGAWGWGSSIFVLHLEGHLEGISSPSIAAAHRPTTAG